MLRRLYPWDPKYRLDSALTGNLHGWFEGKFERYALNGHAGMKALPRESVRVNGPIVPLPLEGDSDFAVTPEQARIMNAAVQLGSTRIRADGVIDSRRSAVTFDVASSDLRDAYFIYSGANGAGAFSGTLSGPIKNPDFNASFTVENFHYNDKLTIQNATGRATFSTATNQAVLENVHVRQGHSEIVVSGMAALSGSPVDLAIRTTQLSGEDIQSFVSRKIRGSLSGAVRLTSFNPMQVDGDVRASNLEVDDTTVGDVQSHIRYAEPVLDLSSLSVSRNGSALTGTVSLNRISEALRFSARVSSVDFEELRWLGFPSEVSGVVAQATLTGAGTLRQPDLRGTAVIRNLKYKTETFPQIRVELNSAGPNVNATFQAGSTLTVTARVDTASKTYPFTAKASFDNYPLQHLAGMSQGTLSATGNATISGLLTNAQAFRGEGRIDSAAAQIQDRSFRTVSPFTFDLNRDRLQLSNVTLAGEGTQGTLAGTIGLTGRRLSVLTFEANSIWHCSGRPAVTGRPPERSTSMAVFVALPRSRPPRRRPSGECFGH